MCARGGVASVFARGVAAVFARGVAAVFARGFAAAVFARGVAAVFARGVAAVFARGAAQTHENLSSGCAGAWPGSFDAVVVVCSSRHRLYHLSTRGAAVKLPDFQR